MTRSKIFDQISIVDDATSAFAKGTAASAVIKATGAGKIQSSTAAAGSYADYATLADGYNNVDLTGANAYLKVITSSAAIAVLSDFGEDPQA